MGDCRPAALPCRDVATWWRAACPLSEKRSKKADVRSTASAWRFPSRAGAADASPTPSGRMFLAPRVERRLAYPGSWTHLANAGAIQHKGDLHLQKLRPRDHSLRFPGHSSSLEFSSSKRSRKRAAGQHQLRLANALASTEINDELATDGAKLAGSASWTPRNRSSPSAGNESRWKVTVIWLR